jgi:hypothetical protein
MRLNFKKWNMKKLTKLKRFNDLKQISLSLKISKRNLKLKEEMI